MSKEINDEIDNLILRLQNIKTMVDKNCNDNPEDIKVVPLPKNAKDINYKVGRFTPFLI